MITDKRTRLCVHKEKKNQTNNRSRSWPTPTEIVLNYIRAAMEQYDICALDLVIALTH